MDEIAKQSEMLLRRSKTVGSDEKDKILSFTLKLRKRDS
jgi:hypothetical protein